MVGIILNKVKRTEVYFLCIRVFSVHEHNLTQGYPTTILRTKLIF